ncbi:MAG: sugar ABC transporter permease [Caldilineaceae bacterium]|nr:sugar ABC transporter permease [Caldilineaceae bacterium]
MAVSSPPASSSRRKGPRWIDVQEQLTGFLFVLPALILVSLFGLFPIGYAFYMSLRRWRVVDRGFIGFANYDKAIGDWLGLALFIGGFAVWLAAYFIWARFFEHRSGRNLPTVALWIGSFLIGAALVGMGWGRMVYAGDDDFLNSLPITLFYAVGSVPIQLALALVLAYILFQQIKGREFFRMAYFLPYVTPVIATALVFRVIFSPRPTSIANRFLELFGIAPQKWLFEPTPVLHLITGNDAIQGFWAGPSLALVSIIFFGIWTYVGYNTVIFLAGLGNIPDTLYEAAEIDGATDWELFRHITVPLLSPVTFYLSLIGFIGTFKAFNHIYVMQQPSALGTVETASVAIFNTFYKASQFGYATAQAMLLFGIILFLTFVQNQIFGKRVFYG